MANGMASLYVGASGLKSAQAALNTTAHNLANINTTGYTRQQVLFSDTQYMNVNTLSGTGNYGLGVTVAEINRIRDQFIDEAYRSSNSKLGYYNSQYKALEEIEDQFGELQGVTYQQSLENLKGAINAISTTPTSTVARSTLIQYATAFIDRSNAVYEGLKSYQTTLNTQVSNTVNSINTLGSKIYNLNQQISQIEANGVETANDLRDQRDNALDELSKYINIDYYEAQDGSMRVSSEGVPFVMQFGYTQMGTRTEDGSNLLIPTWPSFQEDVFNTDNASTLADSEKVGQLKGLLVARGTKSADYSDVPVKPNEKDYDLTTPEGQAAYNKAKTEYDEKQAYYDKYIKPSSILTAMAGLDKLVNGIVESINDVLCPETSMTTTTAMKDTLGNELDAKSYGYKLSQDKLYKQDGTVVNGTDNGDGTYSYSSDEKLFTNADGTGAAAISSYTYSVLDQDNTGYGMDEDKTIGQELFNRTNTERYIKTTDPASGKTVYVRNDKNIRGTETSYSLGNVQINPELAQHTDKIPLSKLDGKEDIERAEKLLDLWSADFASVNPGEYAVGSFDTFYQNFTGEFAISGNVLNNFVSNQTTMVNGYNNQRLQIEGVSSDEELAKMIKYQQAYNAASRYVNVVSEMLEHLVTSLGRG